MTPNVSSRRMTFDFFVSVPLSRWQRIRLRFSWFYIRQTRPFLRLTEWWLNR